MTLNPKFFLYKGRIIALWVMYTTWNNSLKFKLLAFWRKLTPFIDQKCIYEKVTKNLGRALPPPLIWTKSKKNSNYFSWNHPFYWKLYPLTTVCFKCILIELTQVFRIYNPLCLNIIDKMKLHRIRISLHSQLQQGFAGGDRVVWRHTPYTAD